MFEYPVSGSIVHNGVHSGMSGETITLRWQRFALFTDARAAFSKVPCVYVQTNAEAEPLRIGKASKGLEPRYRGGTGHALDAAMHGSGGLVFVATVPKELCEAIESELIWRCRRALVYNIQGKVLAPVRRVIETCVI